jgi:hypothetical protein
VKVGETVEEVDKEVEDGNQRYFEPPCRHQCNMQVRCTDSESAIGTKARTFLLT